MDDILISTGKYAGAIATILALVATVAWKPVRGWQKARKKRREQAKTEQTDFQQEVLGMLRSIGEDVGDLQCDRLTQAHDYYTTLGYCPSTTKQVLVHMHNSYRSKGRNHLCDHYEEDILDLPEQLPPGTG